MLPEVLQGDGWLTYMYCYEVSPSDAPNIPHADATAFFSPPSPGPGGRWQPSVTKCSPPRRRCRNAGTGRNISRLGRILGAKDGPGCG